jgi:hypothetical protein
MLRKLTCYCPYRWLLLITLLMMFALKRTLFKTKIHSLTLKLLIWHLWANKNCNKHQKRTVLQSIVHLSCRRCTALTLTDKKGCSVSSRFRCKTLPNLQIHSNARGGTIRHASINVVKRSNCRKLAATVSGTAQVQKSILLAVRIFEQLWSILPFE